MGTEGGQATTIPTTEAEAGRRTPSCQAAQARRLPARRPSVPATPTPAPEASKKGGAPKPCPKPSVPPKAPPPVCPTAGGTETGRTRRPTSKALSPQRQALRRRPPTRPKARPSPAAPTARPSRQTAGVSPQAATRPTQELCRAQEEAAATEAPSSFGTAAPPYAAAAGRRTAEAASTPADFRTGGSKAPATSPSPPSPSARRFTARQKTACRPPPSSQTTAASRRRPAKKSTGGNIGLKSAGQNDDVRRGKNYCQSRVLAVLLSPFCRLKAGDVPSVVAVPSFAGTERRPTPEPPFPERRQKSAGEKANRVNTRRLTKQAALRPFDRADRPGRPPFLGRYAAARPRRAVPMRPDVPVRQAGARRAKPVWRPRLAERYRQAARPVATRRVRPLPAAARGGAGRRHAVAETAV